MMFVMLLVLLFVMLLMLVMLLVMLLMLVLLGRDHCVLLNMEQFGVDALHCVLISACVGVMYCC